MSEKLVSAGVFTRENDLTFLPQGISAIGAAIIGPTSKGPAFVPTLVESPTDFITLFGDVYEGSYVPYTVKEYLKNAGRATVVRVAGLDGYTSDALGIQAAGTFLAVSPVIYLATSSVASTSTLSQWNVVGYKTLSTDFQLQSGSVVIPTSLSMSLNQNSSSYIGTILGSSFTGAPYTLYVSNSNPTVLATDLAMSSTPYTGSIITSATNLLVTSSGILYLSASATLQSVLDTYCLLAPSLSSKKSVAGWLASWSITAVNTSSLSFVLSSSNSTFSAVSYSLSLNPGDANYIPNVLGTSPGTKDFYVYANYINKQTDLYDYTSVATTSTLAITGTPFATTVANKGILPNGGYAESKTPWIKSQTINSQRYSLFKLHSFSSSPTSVKISISDVKRPDQIAGYVAGQTYGSFTLTVRDVNDTDIRPNALETFANVTLDPSLPNYIANMIGDQYRVYGLDGDGNQRVFTYGDYPNKSKYIRIEMGANIPFNAMPMGFGAYVQPLSNGTTSVLPNVKYNYTQLTSLGDFNFRTYLGFDYTYQDNLSVLNPLATGSAAQALDTIEFNLEYCMMSNATQTAELPFDITNDNANAFKARKFTIALQGGFDGFDPTINKNMGEDMTVGNSMGFDFTTAASTGVSAYKKAIDTISSPDDYDINMIVIPGVTNDLGGSIISYANAVCEDRQDVFFLFDCVGIGGQGALRTTPSNAVNSVLGIDSNYAATYYPWVKIYDNILLKYVWVPPSVVMAGVISFNDRVAAEWWAPAGLNRGGISSALQVASRLTQAERDLLYEGRVNPIATFVGQGIVAWGQKTLQIKPSALDRINVRRLLIAVKKYIASSTKYLVFEQNTVATRTRFLNIANPYLQSVQQKQGLYAFKVVMDETNNTPDTIDRNLLIGAIYLQPTRTAEIIQIDFNILPTGATFSQ